MTAARLPAAFWALWTGFLANRIGLVAPAFLTLFLTEQGVPWTGVAIGAYGLGALGGGLLGGVIADRLGPRRTLWTSQVFAGSAALGLMTAQAPVPVLVFALWMGTFNGFARSAVYGLTALLTAGEGRSRAYGHLYWAASTGSSVTVLLSGLLLEWWPPAMFLPAVVGAAVYAVIAVRLPEPRPAAPARRAGLLADVARPFVTPCVGRFLLVTFAVSCAYAQRHSAVPLEMHRAGLTYGQVGALLGLSAFLVVVVQPVSGRALRGLRPAAVFAAASAFIGAAMAANLFVSTAAGYALVVTLWTAGEILAVPLALAYIADHAPPGHCGAFQGAYGFVWTLGFAVGAPAGQVVLAAAGPGPLWVGAAGLAFAAAAGHLALGRGCAWLGPPGGLRRSAARLPRHRMASMSTERQGAGMTTASAAARYLRDADRLTDGEAPIQTAPLDLGALLGVWRNANPYTFGVCRMEVSERDGRVWTHVWCRDPGADRLVDWGEAPAEAVYAEGPRSDRAWAYRVSFDLGHAVAQLQFNVVSVITVCAAFTRFTDGSGRQDYFSREYMHRRGENS